MDWQLLTTLILVGLAAAWLTRGAWMVWTGEGKGCGSGCKCGSSNKSEKTSPTSTFVPLGDLRLRQRQDPANK